MRKKRTCLDSAYAPPLTSALCLQINMKLVYKSNDPNEANDITMLLENNGIPSELFENDLRNRGTHIPDGQEVHIYVNTQYNDALELIKNPNHEVKQPIDISKFNKTLESEEVKSSINQLKNQFIKYGSIVIAIFLLFLSYLIYIKT